MRFPFWATVWTIVSLAILCALGTWQIQRLSWKTEIVEKIERAYEQDSANNPLNYAILMSEPETADSFFKRGVVTGTFMHEQEILIAPRTHKGAPGYHVITPLQMEKGGIILVNRGWAPLNSLNDIKRPKDLGTITGIIRQPEKPNMFVPQNKPDTNKWYRLNIDEIVRHFGLTKVVPSILYEEKNTLQGLDTWSYPLPQNEKKMPRNNHLQYAIFWFSMALILMIIYYFRFLRKPDQI